jgi:predicted dehydrogenase/ubiquinone/menaquinone biosynthesis C-methylase UbiE
MGKQHLNIAMIGCGAVAERCHLPAVQAYPNTQVSWLVDVNLDRAQHLAQKIKGLKGVVTDYHAIFGLADAAIIALPHSLHAPISIDLLQNGIHVLVEKPMAMSTIECEAMNEAAEKGKAVLAVGLMRRFLHAGRFARWLLETNFLGSVESFDFREGNIYNWPVASDFFFRKETAGGGVLFDTGAHTLDQLLWWLGDVESFQYCDDNYGGVEADCELHLTMKSGAKGIVELSRTRNLRNTAIIRGEIGELEIGLRTNTIMFRSKDGYAGFGGEGIERLGLNPAKQEFADLFFPQIEDWVEAIQTGRTPSVPGIEAHRSVALIEACYSQRQLLEMPWMDFVERTSLLHPEPDPKETKIEEMRTLWNSLSKKSKLGFISHLQQGASWNLQEFHLAGIRFVNQMTDRFKDYGEVELSYASILEIGCGVGRFVKPLACHFKQVVGVDISTEMINVAKENCVCLPNVSFALTDGTSLKEFDDNSFDYCVSAGVFQHITHIEVIVSYIKEAIRILRPGGLFLFQFEGNKMEPVGHGQIGARITARDLDTGLKGLPYKICEVSIDPNDPIRNVVIVIQKLNPEETTSNDYSFKDYKMLERRWLSGVYDDINTKTTMHEKLKEKPRLLTFYDPN